MHRVPFRLCLLFALACMLLSFPDAHAYQLEAAKRVIWVSPGKTPTETTRDIQSALDYVIKQPNKKDRWIIRLTPGKYYLNKQLNAVGLNNVGFVSANLKMPAQLIKDPKEWNAATGGEYLFYTRMCKYVNIMGLEFYGLTTFAKNIKPVWPDQGIHIGSCDVAKVDQNKFYNFGNAALRVVTSSKDPVRGVNMHHATVTNNLFNNIYQISTTSTDQLHGGVDGYLLENNTFVNVRGSLKFASRTPGARNLKIRNNTINGADHFGFEINNYNNIEIVNNNLQNIKNVAINLYTAGTDVVPKGFQWGDNVTISNNRLTNVQRGIRFSSEPFSDGFQATPHNLKIENNTFAGVLEKKSEAPAIGQYNGKVVNLSIRGNKFSNIANGKYIGVYRATTGVNMVSNLVNGKVFNTPLSQLIIKY